MPDVTAIYGKFLDSIAYFGNFHTLLTTIRVCIVVSLLSQIMYVNMPNVSAGCGRLFDLICFFWEFSYIITYLKRYNFVKVFQKSRAEKLTFVIIYVYVRSNLDFMCLLMLCFGRYQLVITHRTALF